MKKAVIVNAHWNNRGDEAALRAMLDKLLNENPNWSFQIIFKEKEIVQFPYDEVSFISLKFLPKNVLEVIWAVLTRGNYKLVGNRYLAESIKRFLEADLLIYAPGGAVICDRFWWVKQLEYLLPFICSKFYNIPIVVAAPSIGSFNREKNNAINCKNNLCKGKNFADVFEGIGC